MTIIWLRMRSKTWTNAKSLLAMIGSRLNQPRRTAVLGEEKETVDETEEEKTGMVEAIEAIVIEMTEAIETGVEEEAPHQTTSATNAVDSDIGKKTNSTYILI